MLEQRIQQQFFDSADLKYAAAEVLAKPIADAVSALVGSITAGGKVLACGNGGSAADAQHYLLRRPPPPPCRFDVIAIDGERIEWLKGAFDAA